MLACSPASIFAAQHGPVFNEMAPRVHNSGHWTIEGAVTSQFENHVRAICGLPLGPAIRARTAERIEMENLIGADAARWPAILADPGAHLHLYGKHDARPGRKMGHVTRLIRPLATAELRRQPRRCAGEREAAEHAGGDRAPSSHSPADRSPHR